MATRKAGTPLIRGGWRWRQLWIECDATSRDGRRKFQPLLGRRQVVIPASRDAISVGTCSQAAVATSHIARRDLRELPNCRDAAPRRGDRRGTAQRFVYLESKAALMRPGTVQFVTVNCRGKTAVRE
jgi:hypothetical protein